MLSVASLMEPALAFVSPATKEIPSKWLGDVDASVNPTMSAMNVCLAYVSSVWIHALVYVERMQFAT